MTRSRVVLARVVAAGFLFVAGCDGGSKSPTAPTPVPTPTSPPTPTPGPSVVSVTVEFPAGGTIFIGSTVQFQAREALSDGTSQVSTRATWGSDNPAVATVSPSGLVTAVAAGEATVYADVNPRGVRRTRVFPDFGGNWTGMQVITGCQDSGDLVGFCDFLVAPFIGEPGPFEAVFNQSDATVTIDLDTGDGTRAMGQGTVSIDGELHVSRAEIGPPEPGFRGFVENWRSRSDVPSQMTGAYEVVLTVDGASGEVRSFQQLQGVSRP